MLKSQNKTSDDKVDKYVAFKADEKTKERIVLAGNKLSLNSSEVIRAAVISFLDAYEKTSAHIPQKE